MHYSQHSAHADELSALRRRYPLLSDKELEEIQYRLGRYMEVVTRIHERVRKDPVAHAELRRRLAERRKEKKISTKEAFDSSEGSGQLSLFRHDTLVNEASNKRSAKKPKKESEI